MFVSNFSHFFQWLILIIQNQLDINLKYTDKHLSLFGLKTEQKNKTYIRITNCKMFMFIMNKNGHCDISKQINFKHKFLILKINYILIDILKNSLIKGSSNRIDTLTRKFLKILGRLRSPPIPIIDLSTLSNHFVVMIETM